MIAGDRCADCRRLTVCTGEIYGELVCPGCAEAPRCSHCYSRLPAGSVDGDVCGECEQAWDRYEAESWAELDREGRP